MIVLAHQALSNNVQVSNVYVSGQNTTDDFTMVNFTVTWENSWRYSNGPANWDAAWIFVKFRVGDAGEWKHAWLHNTGHTGNASSVIDNGLMTPGLPFNSATNPSMGVFLYRSAPGTGTFLCPVALRWNYGANGVADNAIIDVQVFAIECVYVPQGSFFIGSGGTENAAFYVYPNLNTPYQITAENSVIPVVATNGNLYYQPSVYGGDQLGPVPAEFPKGFKAFYALKYEISNKAYADFLNTLTRAQQITRVGTNITGTSPGAKFVMSNNSSALSRNGISCRPSIPPAPGTVEFFSDLNNNNIPNESTDGLAIACSYISYADLAAYLDWAALRLMTEFEFEKCARGPLPVVANEFSWGNNIINPHYGLLNANTINEAPSDYIHNVTGNSNDGPLRTGAYARQNSTRTTSGSGYFGCMELSGNLSERCVTIGNPEGRSYTGVHGNGLLTSVGHHDTSGWPSATTTMGIGFRGGDYNDLLTWDLIIYLRVSDRTFSGEPAAGRYGIGGGRGVRTAE